MMTDPPEYGIPSSGRRRELHTRTVDAPPCQGNRGSAGSRGRSPSMACAPGCQLQGSGNAEPPQDPGHAQPLPPAPSLTHTHPPARGVEGRAPLLLCFVDKGTITHTVCTSRSTFERTGARTPGSECKPGRRDPLPTSRLGLCSVVPQAALQRQAQTHGTVPDSARAPSPTANQHHQAPPKETRST